MALISSYNVNFKDNAIYLNYVYYILLLVTTYVKVAVVLFHLATYCSNIDVFCLEAW